MSPEADEATAVVDSCFVAMPFRAPYNQVYSKVIRPAIESTGLTAVRADDIFSAGDVIGQLVEAIVESDLVVAEISELNANVYYEVGLAHAFRKPTVLLSRSSDTIPFDLRTGRCVIYDIEEPDWGEGLRNQIAASISETRENPLRALPLAISFPAARDGVVHQGAGDDSLASLSQKLDQVSQAVARLVPSLGVSPVHVQPESSSLTATAEQLLSTGRSRKEAIEYLVRSGASTPWAEFTVDEIGSRK